MKFSLIIPCFNECDSIIPLVAKFDEYYIAAKRDDIELVLVDNGSTDQTGKKIDELMEMLNLRAY